MLDGDMELEIPAAECSGRLSEDGRSGMLSNERFGIFQCRWTTSLATGKKQLWL